MTTQRIPLINPLACLCSIPSREVKEEIPHLIPAFSDRTTSLPHSCLNGYTVRLSSLLWAGYIPTGETHANLEAHPLNIACPDVPVPANTSYTSVDDRLGDWIARERLLRVSLDSNPVDVAPYPGNVTPGGGAPVRCFRANNTTSLVEFDARDDGEFAVEFCTRGYCRGGPQDSWLLADVEYPCVEHREGVLCGQCEAGFSITMYSTVSVCCTIASMTMQHGFRTILDQLLTLKFTLTHLGIQSAPWEP